MYSCKEVSRLVSEKVDRKLNWKERLGLGFHLMMCAGCKCMAGQIEWLKKFTGKAANEAVANVSLSEEARIKMKHEIDKTRRGGNEL